MYRKVHLKWLRFRTEKIAQPNKKRRRRKAKELSGVAHLSNFIFHTSRRISKPKQIYICAKQFYALGLV